MAKIRLYLDSRKLRDAQQEAPLKLAIAHQHKTAVVPLNIYLRPSQFDGEKVVQHKQAKALNDLIRLKKAELETVLARLSVEENVNNMSATELRDAALAILHPEQYATEPEVQTFDLWFQKFMSHKSEGTKKLYEHTYRKLEAFAKDDFKKLLFEDINKEWLQNFDDYLATTAPSANARNICLRNIRAVFNYAIDNEITSNYPFRRFKIRPVPTRKRNMPVEILRRIFFAEGLKPWQAKYRDLFKLSFMLIGINVKDLCYLSEIDRGRVSYIRAKTGKNYSIKVEPEAMEIFEAYKGEKHLLPYLDHCNNYRHFYFNLCKGLWSVKDFLNATKNEEDEEIKELTTYWARHSWATIASSLDIPHDTIARALGHGGNTVTDIYIDFDMRKVDEANRRVLNYVLYNWPGGIKPADTDSEVV